MFPTKTAKRIASLPLRVVASATNRFKSRRDPDEAPQDEALGRLESASSGLEQAAEEYRLAREDFDKSNHQRQLYLEDCETVISDAITSLKAIQDGTAAAPASGGTAEGGQKA